MRTSLHANLHLGILGSGQLARMIALAAPPLGIKITALAHTPDDPAAQVCPSIMIGSLQDPRSLRKFFGSVETVIFENEFIPCDLIEEAAQGLPVRLFPSVKTMRFLQDKLNQKQVLEELGIPTAPWQELAPDAGRPELEALLTRFDGSCVLKWAQLGYDGKGTFFLDRSSVAKAAAFCAEAQSRGIRVYAEARIDFKRETALVSSYSVTGELAHYPLVITEQERGVCRKVLGPATAFRVAPRLEKKARLFAAKLARRLQLHGTFAIELFETGDGQLIVNELAPRVHNSGHFTLDAAETSQFENHLRAVLGLPLGSTQSAPAFCMWNLLGPARLRGRSPVRKLPAPAGGLHLHWYGKTEVAAGRKMGHLNTYASSRRLLLPKLREVEDWNRRWEKELKP